MFNPTPPRQSAERNLLFGVLALHLDIITDDALVRSVNRWAEDRTRPLAQVLQEQGALDGETCRVLDSLVEKHLAAHAGDARKSLAALGSLSKVREQLQSVRDPDVQAALTGAPCPIPAPDTFFPGTLIGGSHPTPAPTAPAPEPLLPETLIGGSHPPPASAVFPPEPVQPGTRNGGSAQPLASTGPAPAPFLPGTLIGGSADPSTTTTDFVKVENPSLERTVRGAGLRYRVLRSHAKGGLGEVFVARDEELGREVALKEIQSRHADHPDSRARFLLEGEITGALERPGIVPVYGLGVYADGRPYYAMRFIRGERLQDAINRFHAADRAGRSPGERTLELRRLLGRFVAVCNAVAYAHSRSVLHRDLKPENIMLGPYGETLVVDWGLAKAIGSRECAAVPGEGPMPLTLSGSGTPTQMGEAIGTPAFMSPEQAAGRLDELGPTSDVYSLGATLYCLLTGRAAFHGTVLHVLLDNVRKGSFPRPRETNKEVPRALEAICLKAMSVRAEDRYPTAQALAGDIEHWLADEPVSAYREPLTARLARWGRHHRTLVAGWGVLLVTAVAALGITTALVSNEQRKTKEQRRLAEENFQTALGAVDSMLTEVAQEQLVVEPRMEKKRQALLAKARDYYQQFLAQRGDDPHVRKEAALAHKRLGDISRLLNDYAQAQASYQQAIAMLEELAKAHPDKALYRHELGMSYDDLAEVWRRTSHPKEAADAYSRAVTLQRALVDADPDHAEYRKELGRTHDNLGLFYRDTNKPGEAEKAFQEAIRQFDKLAREHPNTSDYRVHQARANLNMGPALDALGRPKDAEKAYRRAIALQERLAAGDPDTPEYRYELGVTYINLGFLLDSTRGKPGSAGYRKALVQAEDAARRARSLFDRLALDFPSVPVYRKELTNAQNNLAIVLARLRRWVGAAEAWGQALEQLTRLVSKHPGVPEYLGRMATILGNLGWLLLQQKDEPDTAGIVLAAGASSGPAGPLAAVAALHASISARRTELLKQACTRLEKARTLTRLVLKPNPSNPDFLRALRDQTEYLAEARLALGDRAEAARLARELAELKARAGPGK